MPCVELKFDQETYFLLQCYAYKCFSQVDEVMLTLKQAFSTAAAMQSSKNQVKLCEDCPMHDLHKLCERIEGKTTSFHQLTQCTCLSFSTIFQCVSLSQCPRLVSSQSETSHSEIPVPTERQRAGQHIRKGAGRQTRRYFANKVTKYNLIPILY